jgi:hypothetical protein
MDGDSTSSSSLLLQLEPEEEKFRENRTEEDIGFPIPDWPLPPSARLATGWLPYYCHTVFLS